MSNRHNLNRPKPKNKRSNPSSAIDPIKILETILGAGFINNPFIREEPKESVPDLNLMWRKIMMLCHPDKHGNSELSQEVTRWLIENRPN